MVFEIPACLHGLFVCELLGRYKVKHHVLFFVLCVDCLSPRFDFRILSLKFVLIFCDCFQFVTFRLVARHFFLFLPSPFFVFPLVLILRLDIRVNDLDIFALG